MASPIILAATWLGLVTGLVEGVTLWTLQRFNLLGGQIRFLGLSEEAIWVAPAFDLAIFLVVGLVFVALSKLLPRLPVERLAIVTLASLAWFSVVATLLAGRVSIYAMLLLALGLGVQTMRWFTRHQSVVHGAWRRSLPVLGLVAAMVTIGAPVASALATRWHISRLPPAPPGSPNLLVVVIDTLRADHLSAYGYQRPTSPYIDRMAGQGVVFEKAYSTSSWTLPAHASLLTGRYATDHNVDKWRPLDGRYPTLGETLQARGYRTGGFSANVEVFNRRMGFGRGFHHFEDNYQSFSNTAVNTLFGRLFEYYALHKVFGLEYRVGRVHAPDLNRSLLEWIGRDGKRPFFALVNYFDVHSPYIPPQPYRSRYSSVAEPGGLINTDWGMDRIYMGLTPEQLQGEVDAYDGAINFVDDNIRDLMTALERMGLAANTLVVILSDHGESFGEHGLLEHHNSLYSEVVRVPLILWGPGRVPSGLRVAAPTTIAAIPGTLLDLVGAGGTGPFPGPSFRQAWDSPASTPTWPFPVAEVEEVSWVPQQHLPFHGSMRSVVGPEWQYIEHDKFGEELFNVGVDPPVKAEAGSMPEADALKRQLKARLAAELENRRRAK